MTQTNVVLQGDCKQVLTTYPDNFFDSVVTDPPYGLSKEPDIAEVLRKWLNSEPYDHKHGGFMGKAWDSFVPHPDIWKEVYRTLKPGGYALVFAGTRTQDLMTISLRLAGFEVRDVIEWLYFTGFPKSMDVGKAFDKRDGAEREVLTTKVYGANVGGLLKQRANSFKGTQEITAPASDLAQQWDGWGTALKPAHEPIIVVRKPLIGTVADNVERFGTGAINIGVSRIPTEDNLNGGAYSGGTRKDGEWKEQSGFKNDKLTTFEQPSGRFPANIVTVEEDGFFSAYCNVSPQDVSKKASKKDRGEGNIHPTVKPTELMAWLLKLVTPPGGVTLDPFAGSGSTLVAAKREGFKFVGIENEAEYAEIAQARAQVAATSEVAEPEPPKRVAPQITRPRPKPSNIGVR